MLPPKFRLLTLLAVAAASAHGGVAGEVVRERDAEGRVRIVREVTEDAAGNCVNHGLWQEFAGDGRVIAEGSYIWGKRTGVWRRWLDASVASERLARELEGFTAPFLSEASFAAGQLQGEWVISDALQRPCLRIEFQAGHRHGDYQQWNPNGRMIRRETYLNGVLDGEAFVRDAGEQRLVHSGAYVRGYRVVRGAALYDGHAGRRCEGAFLVGPQAVVAADDFWTGRLALFAHGGECIPHGAWRQWHSNGQLAASGSYMWGKPEGEFVWRHANGQRAVVGAYAAGLPVGSWRWWTSDGVQTANRDLPSCGAPVEVAEKPESHAAAAVR